MSEPAAQEKKSNLVQKKTPDQSTGGKSMAPPAMQLEASSPIAANPTVGTVQTGQLMQQQLRDQGTLTWQQYNLLTKELADLQAFPEDGEASLREMATTAAAAKVKEIEACKAQMTTLQKDIKALENPATAPEAINEIIARNNKVTNTTVTAYQEDGRAMIGKDGVTKETKTLESRAQSGRVINDTTTRKDEVGFLNWKGTDTSTREVKVDDKKVSVTKQDALAVDILGTSVTRSKKDEVKVGDVVSSQERSSNLSLNGYTATNTTVEGSEKDKRTEVRTTNAFRGEGKAGVKVGSSTTVEKDGAKKDTKKDASVGIMTGDEGVGMIGGVNASQDKMGKDGLKTGVKAGAKGKFVMNVEALANTNPQRYAITITIGGDLSLGASVGREQVAKPEGDMSGNRFDKASMGVGGSYEGSRGITFRQEMSAEDAKAYLASVTAAEGGKQVSHHKELGIIAAVVNGGDVDSLIRNQANVEVGADPRKLLDNGQSVTTYGSDKLGVDINASVEGGGVGVGIKFGETRKDAWSHTIGKENGQIAVTVTLDEEDASTRGASVGVGLVSGEFGFGQKKSSGQSVKVLIPQGHADHDKIVQALNSAKTRGEVAAILERYGLKPAREVNTMGSGENESAMIKGGPLNIGYGASGSTRESIEETADGKVVRTFEGTNDLGGGIGVGELKYETGARESLSATLDAEGNLSGDLNRTYSETSIGKSGDKFLENLKHNTLGVITGSAKSAEKDVNVAGMILANSDFEHIIQTALDPKAWTKLNNSTMLWEDWQRCREEIVAAGGDKAKATRALAKFMGKSGHGREKVLERAVRDFGTDDGGAKYEFPDGLGDLKGKYLALAVADPSEAVRLDLADGNISAGMSKASSALVQLNDLKFRLTVEQDKFNAGILGEMMAQISARQFALKKMIARGNALKEGKELSEDEVDNATAKDRYTQLIDDVKLYKRQEMLGFQRIEETFEDNHTSRSEAMDNVAETVKLNDLYVKWEKAMQELEALDAMYGVSTSSKEWKQYKPSKRRFNSAVAGKNPFEYTVDQETDDLQKQEQAEKFSEELFHNSAASVEARAQSEGRAAAASRKVERSEACKAWDPQLKAIRDKAYLGGGMCNGMNAGGRKAEIKAEAAKLWGQAFTKLALGASAHENYKMISAHPDAVKLAVDNAAGKVVALFTEATTLFAQGNAAQKAG